MAELNGLLTAWDLYPASRKRDTMRPDTVDKVKEHLQNLVAGLNADGSSPEPAGCSHPLTLAQTLGEAATTPWDESMEMVKTLMTQYQPDIGTDRTEVTTPVCNHPHVLADRLGRASTTSWPQLLKEVARLRRLRDGIAPETMLIRDTGNGGKVFQSDPPEFEHVNKWDNYRQELDFFCRGNVVKERHCLAALYLILAKWKGDSLSNYARMADPTGLVQGTWVETYTALLEFGDKTFYGVDLYAKAIKRWSDPISQLRERDYKDAINFFMAFDVLVLRYNRTCDITRQPRPDTREIAQKLTICLPEAVSNVARVDHPQFQYEDYNLHKDRLSKIWSTVKITVPAHLAQAKRATVASAGIKHERDESDDEAAALAAPARKKPNFSGTSCRVEKLMTETPAVPSNLQGFITVRRRMTDSERKEALQRRERCIRANVCARCRRKENEHSGDFARIAPYKPASVRFVPAEEVEENTWEDDLKEDSD
jgi:hypothetical protein